MNPGSENVSKRHHFRPILHLRHFADDTGRVWVTDTTGVAQPFQQIPDNIAYESYLYAPGDGPAPKSSHVEDWLAMVVDGPAAAPLAKFISTGQADNRERSILARFFAVQDMRTPRARDVIVCAFSEF